VAGDKKSDLPATNLKNEQEMANGVRMRQAAKEPGMSRKQQRALSEARRNLNLNLNLNLPELSHVQQ
jgi:hypothetical protein